MATRYVSKVAVRALPISARSCKVGQGFYRFEKSAGNDGPTQTEDLKPQVYIQRMLLPAIAAAATCDPETEAERQVLRYGPPICYEMSGTDVH
eukprot:3206749-Rhodomonas_salina.1